MKTATRIVGLLVAATVLGSTISACGGEGDTTATATAAAPGAPPGATSGRDSETSPLDQLATRLEAAGFEVDAEGAGDAEGAIEVTTASGETRTSIAFYANPDEAASVEKEIEATFERHPGRGLVEVREGLLLYMAEERELSGEERAVFAEVVSLAGAPT